MNGARVREIREKVGEDREQFGRRLGVSQWTITSWETGRRQPSGSAKILLAQIESLNAGNVVNSQH